MQKFLKEHPLKVTMGTAATILLFIIAATYQATETHSKDVARLCALEKAEETQNKRITKIQREVEAYQKTANLQYIEISGKLNYMTGVLEEIRDDKRKKTTMGAW